MTSGCGAVSNYKAKGGRPVASQTGKMTREGKRWPYEGIELDNTPYLLDAFFGKGGGEGGEY